jgi:hypothetical protein
MGKLHLSESRRISKSMRVGRRRGLFELTAGGYSSNIIAFFLLEFFSFVVSLLAAIIRRL